MAYTSPAYLSLGPTVFSGQQNFEPNHVCLCVCGIMQNLINERWLMRELLRVICVFNPRQLPLFPKQRATYEWKIYLDWPQKRADNVTPFRAQQRTGYQKWTVLAKVYVTLSVVSVDISLLLFQAWVSPVTSLCNILSVIWQFKSLIWCFW